MNSISSRGQRASGAGELEADQVHEPGLGGEGLRGGDADLEAGARQQGRVHLARDLRAHLVRDRDGPGTALAGELHRLDRVARLPRLRDADDEGVLVDDRVAVDPLARDVRLDRDAAPLLDHVPADDAGVVRRPAGDDDDPPQLAELVLVQPEAVLDEDPVPDTVADRDLEPLGLLVDLLEHEGLVALALGDLLVPVDADDLELDRLAVLGADHAHGLGCHLHDVAVIGVRDATCLGEERREVRGEEVLAVAVPDDERRLAAHPDQPVRLVTVDHDEGEMALQAAVHGAHGSEKIAVVDGLEQVRDDLGVGLGAECVTGFLELLLELTVVLHDPVQHDREVAFVAARERMGVVLVHAAVGRPPRVADARRGDRAVLRHGFLQIREIPDGADVLEPAVLEERDPGRVIASELEALEAGDEQIFRGAMPDIADDPAHKVVCSSLRTRKARLRSRSQNSVFCRRISRARSRQALRE